MNKYGLKNEQGLNRLPERNGTKLEYLEQNIVRCSDLIMRQKVRGLIGHLSTRRTCPCLDFTTSCVCYCWSMSDQEFTQWYEEELGWEYFHSDGRIQRSDGLELALISNVNIDNDEPAYINISFVVPEDKDGVPVDRYDNALKGHISWNAHFCYYSSENAQAVGQRINHLFLPCVEKLFHEGKRIIEQVETKQECDAFEAARSCPERRARA